MKKPDYYNYESFGSCDLVAPDFRIATIIGHQAPPFRLQSLNGEMVALADFLGEKHVVLEFGSIT